MEGSDNMATYKRIVKTFKSDYHSDVESAVERFCDIHSDYRVVSCSITSEKHGYSVSYITIVILEKEE